MAAFDGRDLEAAEEGQLTPHPNVQPLFGSPDVHSTVPPPHASAVTGSGSGPSPRPHNTAAHIDTLLAKWRASVAARFTPQERIRTGEHDNEAPPVPPVLDKRVVVPVWQSVFPGLGDGQAIKPTKEEAGKEIHDHQETMSHEAFEALVEQIRLAIDAGVHPRLNRKGSSGSYFARNLAGRTLGIFKPADEEPYGTLNPKFVKWVHRRFLSRVIPFGRACLLPGQSFISEAAASIVDRALGTHIVPRTEVVELSSEAFFYDWVDRERAARKGTPLRPKPGSLQVFLEGFVDASAFLAQHPFPGRPVAPASKQPSRDAQLRRRRHRRGCCTALVLCLCGRTGAERDQAELIDEGEDDRAAARDGRRQTTEPRATTTMRPDRGLVPTTTPFTWTTETFESFRLELEKLVVLDFLIRNTDRGLDNFMLKPCTAPCQSSPGSAHPHLHLAAIDNSLAFPHQHPSGWRTFTYGWLYLPVSLIGQPWSARARAHFLPLLSDPEWWATLRVQLRREFTRDRAFSDEMWERQWSLVKGQGYLLVESFRTADEGPVELCRRPKKLVVDEYRLVPRSLGDVPPAPSPHLRRLDSEPGLASGELVRSDRAAAQDTGESGDRPSLPERRSAPVLPVPAEGPRAPQPVPPAQGTTQVPIVVRHVHHRRSRSDFGGGGRAAGRPRHVLTSSLSASYDGQDVRAARRLRGPLDVLAGGSVREHERDVAHAAPEEARPADGDDEEEEEEDEEETGVGLLSRLDRVEATEQKRFKRFRHDRDALRALGLEAGLSGDGHSEAGPGSDLPPRRPGWPGRRTVGKGPPSRSSSSSETTGLLRQDAIDEQDEEDNNDGEEDEEGEDGWDPNGRLVMSWYGGQSSTDTRAGRAAPAGPRSSAHATPARDLHWVVVERLEDVKEATRSWPWRW